MLQGRRSADLGAVQYALPYNITLSHSIGLACSSSATTIVSSSDWHQRTTLEISLACQ